MTARLHEALPSLRRRAEFGVLTRAFAAGSRTPTFRVVHVSVQSNHVHLLVEANGARALSRGMNGVLVRIARGLNALWRRRGPVFADRHHARVLETPREVRNALVYVLHNARRHGVHVAGVDPYSSGPWFDGWRALPAEVAREAGSAGPSPFAKPRTWLLAQGWRRHGAIGIDEVPAAARRKRARSAGSG